MLGLRKISSLKDWTNLVNTIVPLTLAALVWLVVILVWQLVKLVF